jgi:hypothetical protein
VKKKEVVNPFLIPKPPDETEHPIDKDGFSATKSEAYRAKAKELFAAWSCHQHPGSLCLARALNGHHKVLSFEGELVWVLDLVREIFFFYFFFHSFTNHYY